MNRRVALLTLLGRLGIRIWPRSRWRWTWRTSIELGEIAKVHKVETVTDLVRRLMAEGDEDIRLVIAFEQEHNRLLSGSPPTTLKRTEPAPP
jgi:hypothetical protein